jgi:hypothetical protein
MLLLPMDDSRAAQGRLVYILFIFLVFMLFSPNAPNPYRLLALEALAAREKHSLEVLQNASYSAPYQIPQGLNLTGVILAAMID